MPVVLLLAACGSLNHASTPLGDYQPEAFDSTRHTRHFAVPPEQACEAARRALLSQGYVVATAEPSQVSARKYFQPDPMHHVQLEFRVVCAPGDPGGQTSIAFASGLNDQYVVRKIKQSASLGVGGFGSLSLPIEGAMDSMVKVASETITRADVYQQLFKLMVRYLDSFDTSLPTMHVVDQSP